MTDEDYLKSHVYPILEELVLVLLRDKPANPREYLREYIGTTLGDIRYLDAVVPAPDQTMLGHLDLAAIPAPDQTMLGHLDLAAIPAPDQGLFGNLDLAAIPDTADEVEGSPLRSMVPDLRDLASVPEQPGQTGWDDIGEKTPVAVFTREDPLRAFIAQAQSHVDSQGDFEEEDDSKTLLSPTASGGMLSPTHSPRNIEKYLKQGARVSIPAESTDSIIRRFEEREKNLVKKSDSERQEILRLFKSSILFQNKSDVSVIINAMVEETVPEPDTDIPLNACIIFIGSGEIETEKICKGVSETKLNVPGDIIGELSGIYRCECEIVRMTSTDWDTRIWRIERDFFDYLLRSSSQKKKERHLQLLESVPVLATMDIDELHKICDAIKEQHFADGELIVKEGDLGDTFFIVESGTAAAQNITYGPGDYFGELSLIRNEPRVSSIVAYNGDVTVLSLDRMSFKRLLGPIEKLLLRNIEI
jgi:cAMP-dependent protein kinase regulator